MSLWLRKGWNKQKQSFTPFGCLTLVSSDWHASNHFYSEQISEHKPHQAAFLSTNLFRWGRLLQNSSSCTWINCHCNPRLERFSTTICSRVLLAAMTPKTVFKLQLREDHEEASSPSQQTIAKIPNLDPRSKYVCGTWISCIHVCVCVKHCAPLHALSA